MQLNFAFFYDKALPFFVTSLFVLFVVMLPRYTDTAKTWFVLLILTALGYLLLNLKQLKETTLPERIFFAAVIFNFLWIAFTYYVNGEPGRGASLVWGRHFYLLFLIPLFFVFRKIEIPDKVILTALLLSVLVSFTDILIDIAQGVDHRWQGMSMNAFGPIQLCLSGILFFFFLNKSGRFPRWLTMIGFTLGLATVVLSNSRSTWMTLAMLSIFFVFYLTRAQSIRKRFAAVTGILLLLSSSYLLPMVKVRIDYAIKDISSYVNLDSQRQDSRLYSIGERLELWKAGWKVFLDNPVLGAGTGGFGLAVSENFERYQANKVVRHNKYLHNQYIATLAMRGFPGFIVFLLVIGLPIYIAVSCKPLEQEYGTAKLSIVLICLTYIIGCMAEDHFEGKSATMFFSVLIALLLARISVEKSRQVPNSSQ